jgi:hypothetical protein
MATYAIVKNGVVVNIAEASPEFASEQGWVECPQYHDDGTVINIGHLYDGKFSKPPSPSRDLEKEWEFARVKRNTLLTQSDVNVLPDRWASMNTATQQAWSTYRQALRDIPETYGAPTGDPMLIVWPKVPN